ncbi:hypothetical protein [Cryptosporangium japonicum]|uniref:Arsenate reductase n=1 Tax=Cryptosporangium japonicum TaxID=80872 RepID=A0ABN0U2Y8_9ACTN
MTTETPDLDWAPSACTLPTPERPLRVAEFDALFAASLRRVERLAPTRLRLALAETGDIRATAEDLTARETACCSFFSFALRPGNDGELLLDTEVPASQVAVLDALAARASAVLG